MFSNNSHINFDNFNTFRQSIVIFRDEKSACLSVDEAFSRAGLKFEVEKRPLYQLVDGEPVLVPKRFLVARTDTNAPLGVVGPKYTPFQCGHLAKFVESFCEKSDSKLLSAGYIENGACVWAMTKAKSYETVAGDPHEELFMIRNTFDGSSSLDIGFVDRRVVCNNMLKGIFFGNSSGISNRYSIAHNMAIHGKVNEIGDMLANRANYTRSYVETMKIFASKKLATSAARVLAFRLFERKPAPEATPSPEPNPGPKLLFEPGPQPSPQSLFEPGPKPGSKSMFDIEPEPGSQLLFDTEPEPEEDASRPSMGGLRSDFPQCERDAVNEIMRLISEGKGVDIPGVRGTVYGWFQAVTEYVDHYKPYRGSNNKGAEGAQFKMAFFGAGAKMKAKAFELALAA
jgi:phage/plasmid-like protein (TIGR03299 family)